MVYIYSDINNLLTCLHYALWVVFANHNNPKTHIFSPTACYDMCFVSLSLTCVATIILRHVMDSRYSKNFNDRNSELDNLYQSRGV